MSAAKPTKSTRSVDVQQVSTISPHSKALYETGKAILLDTVSTGREFCKSMIGVSTGAIPIYLGILTFLLPKEFGLGISAGWTIALPAIGFLVTSLLFTFGYLPVSGKFSLDIVEEIEGALEKIINSRKRFIWSGLVVFVFSTLFAIWAILINIGVK